MMLGFNRGDIRIAINLVRMDLRDKHLGSGLGLLWTVLQPLTTLSAYIFVFGFLFKARIPGAETTLGYSIWMICGIGPWLATSEAIIAGANSICSHANIVKNVPMKTELLTFSGTMTGMIPLAVTLFFLLVLMPIDGNYPTWHVLYLIPTVFLHFMFIFGLSLFLAPLVVFVRDVAHALPGFMMLIMFLTPIFYTIDIVPKALMTISHANPFYIIIHGYRSALISHQTPSLWGGLYVLILSSVMILVGLRLFRRVKPYFDSAL